MGNEVCLGEASVVIPTWNQAGLGLRIVNIAEEGELSYQNVEISAGDNVDGTVSNTITIAGIDIDNGALDALEDFGVQIIEAVRVAKEQLEQKA